MKRRNNLDVCVDILQTAQGGTNKTSLVVKSNLNFQIIKQYLTTLTNCGFLTIDRYGRYHTTGRGEKFAEDYLNLIQQMNQEENDTYDADDQLHYMEG